MTYTLPGGEKVELLRVQSYPGRYHMGDFTTHEEISRKIHDLELIDLEPVFDYGS